MHFWIPKFSKRSLLSIDEIIKHVSNTFNQKSYHYLNKLHWENVVALPGYLKKDREPERTDVMYIEQELVTLSFYLFESIVKWN